MKKTPYYSYKLNSLAKGCQLCVQGRKSVLFITGICPEACFYCPISEQKFKKDVTYINEWPTEDWKNIITEIQLCKSKGVGITGGDPLARLSRTILFIKKLKKTFGKKFHIHLYTPLTLVNNLSLKRLYEAGLDEIRFHPNLCNPDKRPWQKILLAKKFKWKVGVEIPVIPNHEKITKSLIDFLIKANIDFLNLNELEYSDTNANHLAEKGYKTRNRLTYAITGSSELALKLLRYIEKKSPSFNVHYCTAKLKDSVQMRNRIKLRLSSVKKPYDKVSGEGTLIRGAIYLGKSLGKSSRSSIIKNLQELRQILKREFKLKNLELDKSKLRLITSEKEILALSRKIAPKLFKLAIVEEYPTYDAMEIEIDFLS
jgi:pyruvate formate-lyase activating enzyme-like uncharacterized protein